jgi:Fungal specific transcription factor domain
MSSSTCKLALNQEACGQPTKFVGDGDMIVSEFNGTPIPSNISVIPQAEKPLVSASLECHVPPSNNSTDSSGIYFGHFRPNIPQRCMEAFHQYFYDAHPFLPPRHHLLQMLKINPTDHLQAAIYYIGSRYVPGASTTSFALEFESFLSGNKPAPKDASLVQAMLLFALGLDGNNERQKAIEILIKAQSLAVELGMNRREYAVNNGRGSLVREESLRRTWWELYVVGIMMAGFHGSEMFHHKEALSNVYLPCEEKEFASGVG